MATIQSSIELYDSFTPVLNNIMNAMNLTISTVHDMQGAVGGDINMDSISNAEAAIHQAEAAMISFNNTMAATESPQVALVQPPQQEVEIPVHWQVDNMEVFTNTGIERFEQEAQSANAMMQTLSQRQAQIATAAAGMDILPPQASADMMTMQTRIQNIQQRIMDITSNPVNMGTDRANAELEQLRAQLSTALDAQNDLNSAMERMDVSDANSAYLRLSNTISGTERNIRDNVTQQGQFNQSIQTGTHHAGELMRTIKGAVAAYISFRSVGAVINISDRMAQTEARMNLIVDDGGSVEELKQKIFASAQEARANYQETASVIAKLGLQAEKAFSGTDEIIGFSELMSKNFKIAGASIQEQTAAMYQLTQAMSAGKLQGDEYRSIIENAPLLAKSIEEYMVNVQQAEGSMKEWASEGKLTADVIKNALFSSADEINQRFEQIPMTWGEIWTSMQNRSTIAFEPVLQKINSIANSDRFNTMVNMVIVGLTMIADVAVDVFDLFISGAEFIYDNWDVIGPVFYFVAGAVGALAIASGINAFAMNAQAVATGIATFASNVHSAALARQSGVTFGATVQQYGLNAALLACPITWIVLGIFAIIAAIFIVTAIINKVTGASISAAGMIVGCVYYIMGAITNCGLLLDNIFFGAIEAAKACGHNIKEAFNVAINKVKSYFYRFAEVALNVIAKIADALSQLPFVTFDAAGISAAASAYAAECAAKAEEYSNTKADYQNIGEAWDKGFNTYEYLDLDAEFERGYEWGQNIQDKLTDALDFSDDESDKYNPDDYLRKIDGSASNAADSAGSTAGNTGAIADNTADMADALDITNEELKYLRDIAERDIIDRTVYRDINIDMKGMQNIVKNEEDLDGIASRLASKLTKQLQVSAEGV